MDLDMAFGDLGWSSREAEIYLDAIELTQEVKPRNLELVSHITSVFKPQLILEVGSWKGASTIQWLKNSGNHSRVVALDTWLGSIEHQMNQSPEGEWAKSQLELFLGRPRFYEQFLKIMAGEKLLHRVYPLNATSRQGLNYLFQISQRFEVIYLDASHDLVDVYLDLVGSISVLADNNEGKSGAVLCGDDYLWPEVAAAVNAFAKSQSLNVFWKHNSWAITEFLDFDTRSKLENLFMINGWVIQKPGDKSKGVPIALKSVDELIAVAQTRLVMKDLKDLEVSSFGLMWRIYKHLRRSWHQIGKHRKRNHQ